MTVMINAAKPTKEVIEPEGSLYKCPICYTEMIKNMFSYCPNCGNRIKFYYRDE